MLRLANLLFAGVVCAAILMIVATIATSEKRANWRAYRANSAGGERIGNGDSKASNVAGASNRPEELLENTDESNTAAKSTSFPVIVRRPAGPPQIQLAGADPQGRSASVACATCHSVRPPNFENRSAQSLDEFHQGLQFYHGQLACYSCHNPENADMLRLADGTGVEYADVMSLCTQCHSKQAESFAHGAHGGMNGFWDLSRGPQTKNNCIDCHDPHAPNYPKMIVDFKPRDRFLDLPKAEHDKHE